MERKRDTVKMKREMNHEYNREAELGQCLYFFHNRRS